MISVDDQYQPVGPELISLKPPNRRAVGEQNTELAIRRHAPVPGPCASSLAAYSWAVVFSGCSNMATSTAK